MRLTPSPLAQEPELGLVAPREHRRREQRLIALGRREQLEAHAAPAVLRQLVRQRELDEFRHWSRLQIVGSLRMSPAVRFSDMSIRSVPPALLDAPVVDDQIDEGV